MDDSRSEHVTISNGPTDSSYFLMQAVAWQARVVPKITIENKGDFGEWRVVTRCHRLDLDLSHFIWSSCIGCGCTILRLIGDTRYARCLILDRDSFATLVNDCQFTAREIELDVLQHIGPAVNCHICLSEDKLPWLQHTVVRLGRGREREACVVFTVVNTHDITTGIVHLCREQRQILCFTLLILLSIAYCSLLNLLSHLVLYLASLPPFKGTSIW